jgi:hypothetical protein
VKIDVADVAELLEIVVRFPRNCEQYGIEAIARKQGAADTWVLTHRPEFDAMNEEAFPSGMPKRKGEVMRRHAVLTGMVYVKCGFPDFPSWCALRGHPNQRVA